MLKSLKKYLSQCLHNYKNLKCQNCSKTIPSENLKKLNYFEIFNLPIKYNLDKKQLAKNFRNYQMEFHPDKIKKNITKSQQHEKNEENIIYFINKIHFTLKNDLNRGYYILKLKNIIEDLEKKKDEGINEDFLEQMFDINMQLIENDQKDIVFLKDFLNKNCDESFSDIDQAFLKEDFGKMLIGLNKFSYYLKALDNLENHKLSN